MTPINAFWTDAPRSQRRRAHRPAKRGRWMRLSSAACRAPYLHARLPVRGMVRVVFLVALSSLPTSAALFAADACSQMEGRTFRSVDSREVGLGPEGSVMGHWSIGFRAGKFSWRHSDVSESGSYTCSGSRIIGQGFRRTYSGEYRRKRGVLTWQGMEYERLKEK